MHLLINMKQTNCLDIHSFLKKIYFITISRLKCAKNKAEAEISKRIDIILCVRASVNTMQFYDITVLSDYTQLPLTKLKKSSTFVSITLFLCEILFSKPKRPGVVWRDILASLTVDHMHNVTRSRSKCKHL